MGGGRELLLHHVDHIHRRHDHRDVAVHLQNARSGKMLTHAQPLRNLCNWMASLRDLTHSITLKFFGEFDLLMMLFLVQFKKEAVYKSLGYSFFGWAPPHCRRDGAEPFRAISCLIRRPW